MKILIVCQHFYPSKLGGPANTLYWLSKGLVHNGYDVIVVTTNNHIDKGCVKENEWTNIDGIKVKYCTTDNKLQPTVIQNSLNILNKTDVIILNSICYLPNFPIVIKSLINKKKIIWSPRGELYKNAINKNILKKLYFKLLKHIIRNKVIFHATCEDEKNAIIDIMGNDIPIVTIPNYMELPNKEEYINNDNKYFLFLGRIAPIKNIENLIKGCSLSKTFLQSNYVLNIVGGVEKQFKNYYNKLLTLTKDLNLVNKVYFLGQIDGKLKYRLFANAQFTFLISHSENFGNVALESLSQGTPVVASKGTPWATLETNNAGYYIDNNPQDIASCIDEIMTINEDRYQQIRQNAYKLSHKFNIYNNIKKWIDILNNK